MSPTRFRCATSLIIYCSDNLAEWLRRWPAKPLCSAREGSNPSVVAILSSLHINPKNKKCFRPGPNRRPWDYETHALPTAPRKQEMRHPGIEPGAPRWQRGILPLNQWRFTGWQNDPGGTRTPNRLIRSQARYPLRHGTFDM